MSRMHRTFWWLFLGILCLAASACQRDAAKEQALEERLERARALRYVSLDSVEALASPLTTEEGVSTDVRLEALCLTAFARTMRADYGGAATRYGQVMEEARSELARLEAQIGMMRVCMRRGANREFYDYYNGALSSSQRLQGTEPTMSAHERLVWEQARDELQGVLCVYYYYLRMETDAAEALARMEERETPYYYFLRGNARGFEEGPSSSGRASLWHCLSLAREQGLPYWEAKAMSSLSQGNGNMEGARTALATFSEYGSPFDVSQSLLLIGRLWLDVDGDSALSYSLRAEEVLTQAVGEDKEAATWVPEWAADVHEGLCMVYSALGMKAESDAHRNAYLDILDESRQDRRMEQRLTTLEREQEGLMRSIWLTVAGALVGVLLLTWVVRRMGRGQAARYEQEKAALEVAMEEVVKRSDADLRRLHDHVSQLEESQHAQEQRLEEGKRQWVDKLTCLSIVSGITPFLDRLVHELRHGRRREYIIELTDRINLLNDILTGWISLRRGAVRLRIETFDVQGLFNIVAKSSRLFARKGLTLHVEPTTLSIRGDRALTLFMLNTLLDNARKFTASGGKVVVEASECNEEDGYVEVSVQDSGQPETETMPTTTQQGSGDSGSGHGFGLMNCRGIIERYRKTSQKFSGCLLNVEHPEGGGSRYYFRLPKGVMTLITVLCWGVAVYLGAAPTGAAAQTARRTITDALPADSTYAEASAPDSLLMQADEWACRAYDANVYGAYEEALEAVDSACYWLNRYYLSTLQAEQSEVAREGLPETERMVLFSTEHMAEIDLWRKGVDTDYHIILDIRNEAAIAALALKLWDVYYYNNEIYNRLYKLMAQDEGLEAYCMEMAAANANRRALALFIFVLLIGVLLAFYIIYYRSRVLIPFTLRQILELGKELIAAEDEQGLADTLREGINPIRRTDGVCLRFCDGRTLTSRSCPGQEYIQHLLTAALEQPEGAPTLPQPRRRGRIFILPLQVEEPAGGQQEELKEGIRPEEELPNRELVGAMAVVMHSPTPHPDDERLLALIAKHTAAGIYYSSVRSQQMKMDLELASDEQRRAQAEAEQMHVRNMVMDNCLSTIKHETMYYPARIRTLIEKGEDGEEVAELATYYKEVFSTLCACAMKQVERPMLRRSRLSATQVETLCREAASAKGLPSVTFIVEDKEGGAALLADENMLRYLFCNLAEAATFVQAANGKTAFFSVNARKSGKFVTFACSFNAPPWSADQMQTAFHPEVLADKGMPGAHLLIAKEIVRLHDEFVRRGCGIHLANRHDQPSICFTLPAGE